MRGKIAIGAAILAALVVGMVTVSFAAGPRVSNPTRIHVVEHPKSDHVTNTGKSGDTAGDLLTFHNPIYNGANSKRIGHDQGDCIRISPKRGTWECRWVTFVPGGSIAVEGPFYDKRNSTMAVTGGTGDYRNARGSMVLRARAAGFDFIFHVLP
jgi:dirigent-like protein